MSVKVIDKATGEYVEIAYDSYEDFAVQYDELTQKIAALERAKKKMNAELKQVMGDESELSLTNGWRFTKSSVTRMSYSPLRVTELLEDDSIRFLKVDKTKLDAELKEHIEDKGRWTEIAKELRSSLEVDSVSERLQLVKPGKLT